MELVTSESRTLRQTYKLSGIEVFNEKLSKTGLHYYLGQESQS